MGQKGGLNDWKTFFCLLNLSYLVDVKYIDYNKNYNNMSLFKKLFGSKDSNKPKKETTNEGNLESYNKIPWMTDLRRETLSTCLELGFKPAFSLPTEFDKQLRPSIEIANRLNAIKALVLWLMVPQEHLPTEKIINFIQQNNLAEWMTEEEKTILRVSRNDEQARNSIGWKFENAWPLAWYFGYIEPEITGQMMTGEQMQEILINHTCPIDKKVEDWIQNKTIVSEEKLRKKEDLFYCLHNAVRSAQLGDNTVPNGFGPIGNGGVIHERRHSLTWMLSKNVPWATTDLST